MYKEFGRSKTPAAIVVAGFYLEYIFPRRQIGIGDTSRRNNLPRINPVLIKSFQFVGKQIPSAGKIIDYGEMDAE